MNIVRGKLGLKCGVTLMQNADIFAGARGPRDAEIILVGEAWDNGDAGAGLAFCGTAGKELERILVDAGLSPASILYTNVMNARPRGNDFLDFLYPIAAKQEAHRGIHPTPELLSGLHRVQLLVDAVKPKLVIAAGNWPLFALSNYAAIATVAGFKLPSGAAKWRGSQLWTNPIGNRSYPLLPVVHPSTIFRDMSLRNVTVHDLRARAARFIHGKTRWEAPEHNFIIRPKLWQVQSFFSSFFDRLSRGPERISVDLETYRRRWISVIGLADAETALAIPLFHVDRSKDQEQTVNYWTTGEEIYIFETLKQLLEHPNVQIIGQNFIYDTQWLHRLYNINAEVTFDTMVAHHLAYPGTPKALDHLASLYCDHYIYWKDESGDWDNFPEDAERYWLYNAKDIRATYEIAGVLSNVLKHEKLEELYQDRMEQWKMAREMMLKGINFDTSLQREMKLQLHSEANALQEWLLSVVPQSWQYTSTGKPWFDSPKGTATILYQVLGLPPQAHKKTKKLTVDAEALSALRALPEARWLSPLLERLEHLRSLGVFISHFLEARTSPDGRMKCTFNVAHPDTFRWSSNSNGFGEGTNLQNIPK